MLAGLLRHPGPVIGTLVAAAVTAALTAAAIAVGTAQSPFPPGRLASAGVVVAGSTVLQVTTGHGAGASTQSVPLPAYRGIPASLARELAAVPGVVRATPENGFPDGATRPGTADLIAITVGKGVSPVAVEQRVRAALQGGAGYTIATGAARGDLANIDLPVERANGRELGFTVIPFIVLTALFTLAATTALAVSLRRRRYALLRAVGATRGQVRRAVLAEQALLAAGGGLLGYLPGVMLGRLGVSALASHGILPPGSADSASPWLVLAGCAVGLPACLLSGLAAARRAARATPAQAMRESRAEHRRLPVIRTALGLAAGAGLAVLAAAAVHSNGPAAQEQLIAPLLLTGLVAVALLGPVLVAAVAAAARPLRATGPAARLALAGISALPRRTASAVIPVALSVGLIGAIAFSNTSINHATTVQSAAAVRAGAVLEPSAAGGELASGLPAQVQALPGARGAAGISAAGISTAGISTAGISAAGISAAGISTVSLAVEDPSLEYISGAAIGGANLARVLDMGVVAGQLNTLRPGQVAVSEIEASAGSLGVRLGSPVTVYLPDGTPYRATVSAIYSRSLPLGSLLIPASVAAGHTGAPPGYNQVLVTGASPRALAALTAAHPGVTAASRQVYNAQVQAGNTQNTFSNLLVLGVVAALAAVTLVNTLAVATSERRRSVRLLAQTGATARQVAGMFGWHALFVTVTGIGAGVLMAAGTLIAIDRAETGAPGPYIPPTAAAAVIGAVTILATATIMASLRAMTGRRG
jgi:putative ABC transport system permease protein